MQGIKRAAYELTTKSSTHGSLSMVLYEQKAYHEELLKVITLRSNVMSSLLKWVTEQENFAVKDVYARMAELEWMWSKIMHDIVTEEVNYRKVFKSLLAEEKSVDEIRKTHAASEAKVEKLQKQIESTKSSKPKKSEKAKIEALDGELAAAIAKAQDTGAALEERRDKLEKQKAMMVKEALVTHSNTYLKITEKNMEIYKAQAALADLIPNVPTQQSKKKVYSSEDSERIVNEARENLQLGKPPSSIYDPSYSPVYQPWNEHSGEKPLAQPAMTVTPDEQQYDNARPDGSQTSKASLSSNKGQAGKGSFASNDSRTSGTSRSASSVTSSSEQSPPELPPRPPTLYDSPGAARKKITPEEPLLYEEMYVDMTGNNVRQDSTKSDPGDLASRHALSLPPLPHRATSATDVSRNLQDKDNDDIYDTLYDVA
ncbi:uncharacterized protein DDB_G0284459-like [Ptychodera flava]|uniref:uncharacterized protein DDB_G0284459-like n=1 Tax=Ptychodera flava TaxID=63121 RepID=UPI00396A6728